MIMRAVNSKSKRGERERVPVEDDSEDGYKEEGRHLRRDYITLKNKITKTKLENED